MTLDQIVTALVAVLTGPTRGTPLAVLARPKYPSRELDPQEQPDGTIRLTVAKWGFEYKHRGPKPKLPPPANTEGIQQALNHSLAPSGLAVTGVTDKGTYTIIIIGGTQNG